MLIAALAAAAEVEPDHLRPFLVAAFVLVVFVTLAVVTWSYRDVANRHSDRTGGTGHDSHSAGH